MSQTPVESRTVRRGPSYRMVDAGGLTALALMLAVFAYPAWRWVRSVPADVSATSAGFEVTMLVYVALLALLLPLLQIGIQIRAFGGAAVRGNRIGFPAESGIGGRVARAHRNLIEALAPFAAVVLAAHAAGVSTRWTAVAAAVFLAARLVHAASYVLGITVLRSAAFYAGLFATALIAAQLLLNTRVMS